MLFDAVERAYTVTNTNFTTDLNALATAKGIAAPAAATIVKRIRPETHAKLKGALPFLGVRGIRAATAAKFQGWRDTVAMIEWEYYLEGTDPSLLARQAELAAEAVLKTVDRLAGSGDGLFGAGEGPGAVTVEMTDDEYEEAEEDKYWHRAIVRAPVADRDEGV